MDKDNEYISYKKLLVFGAEGSGKTTFSKYLETDGTPSEITHTENGNLLFFNIF